MSRGSMLVLSLWRLAMALRVVRKPMGTGSDGPSFLKAVVDCRYEDIYHECIEL